MDFQELFIWLAQEHYFWRLMGVLASLGSSLGAHGSSWWIYHFLFDYPDVTSHARDVYLHIRHVWLFAT